jgi:hypothetical protein
MKMLEPNFYSLFSLSHLQTRTFVDLVRLYHETAPILEYGKKAIECYVKALSQPTKHDDYWIVVQEWYKDLYYMLQFHNFALWIASHGCTFDRTCDIEFPGRLQQLWNQSLMLERASAGSSVSQEIWSSLWCGLKGELPRSFIFSLLRTCYRHLPWSSLVTLT